MQVHESLQHDTIDQEDHSFSGIMFDISANSALPVDLLQLESVWVRGALGPMSVAVFCLHSSICLRLPSRFRVVVVMVVVVIYTHVCVRACVCV